MTERERAIWQIGVGDIFHAKPKGTASFICLTLQITEKTIVARRMMTSESRHVFDRTTGLEIPEDDDPLTIDSVAPLPADIREIMLGLDRKYAGSNAPQLFSQEARLTKEERRGLLFVARFYRAHPI